MSPTAAAGSASLEQELQLARAHVARLERLVAEQNGRSPEEKSQPAPAKPFDATRPLTRPEVARYGRQLIMPELGCVRAGTSGRVWFRGG